MDLVTVFWGFLKAVDLEVCSLDRIWMGELRDECIHQKLYLEGPWSNPNKV